MATVPVLVAEFQAAAEVILTLIEGEAGLSTSGMSQDTVFELNSALEVMRRRLRLLQTAIRALQDLDGDDYPHITQRFVDDSVVNEMRAHFVAMQAALSQFVEQVGGEMTFGEPVPK